MITSKSLIRFTAVSVLVLASACIFAGFRKIQNNTIPVSFRTTPPRPSANQDIMCTVEMSQPVSSDQDVALGCTDPQSFTNLPSYVTVPAGASSTSFPVHTSSTYKDSAMITASSASVAVIW